MRALSLESTNIMEDFFSEDDVLQYFDLIQNGHPEAPVELRALNFRGRYNNTYSGYYNNPAKFIEAVGYAAKYSGGIYMPINVLKPDLIARRANKSVEFAKITTSDSDIILRQFIPIDIDPKRSAGVPSTDDQHSAAIAKAWTIYDWILKGKGPEPIVCDSGNGAHLLFPDNLPNDEESKEMVHNFLFGLDDKFSDDVVEVDTTVYNAARIMRLPGTMNRKGSSLPKYPHRMAKVLSIPKHLESTK
ncbi:MAG TPA: hypothetical protein EYN39_12145 [Deltaproteobacteria bacterium]|nr:hypothetical protein [Deltaproteobacteria bacterium]